MRIVRLMHFSKEYVRLRYAADAKLDQLPYEEQKRRIFSDFYSFADSWEYWLRRAGIEATDVPLGIAPLDAAFEREYGSAAASADLAVPIAVLRRLAPNLLFLSSIEYWTAERVAKLRTAVPSIRAVLGMAGVDVYHLPVLRQVDVLLTCMKGLAARLCADGAAAFFMPHAFDPRILEHIPSSGPRAQFAFFGNVHSGAHWHDMRRAVLETLVEHCGLTVYSSSAPQSMISPTRYLKLSAAHWAGRLLQRFPGVLAALPFGASLRRAAEWPSAPSRSHSARLAAASRPPVFGLAMYRELAATQMTVNIHAGIAGPYAANMRLFEATGAGTCLLTDAKSDLDEFFASGEEVVTFENAADAVAKARELLANPARMAEIGRRGQARTLRDHTYELRVPAVIAAAATALEQPRSTL
jgi:spore maturation protein CgeB